MKGKNYASIYILGYLLEPYSIYLYFWTFLEIWRFTKFKFSLNNSKIRPPTKKMADVAWLTKQYHHHQGLGTDKLKHGEIAVQMKKVRSGHLVKAATEANVQATLWIFQIFAGKCIWKTFSAQNRVTAQQYASTHFALKKRQTCEDATLDMDTGTTKAYTSSTEFYNSILMYNP